MLSKIFMKSVETINNDTQNGATQIAEDSLRALKRECLRIGTQLDESILKTAIQLLLDTHPMATIENALLPIYIRLVDLIDSEGLKSGNAKASIEMIFATRKEQMRVGEINTINRLVEELREKKSILTFSHSSTVIKALLQLAKDGFNDKEIYVLESRPLKEGERTAHSLANAGYRKTHLGIDFSINEFSELAETAVIGADMVHFDGHILNKIGSATIAKLFHSQTKEVIVGASLSKICLRGIINQKKDWNPLIPNRNPKEVSSISNPNLKIWNKYFEIIEPKFISTLIMDKNKFSRPISSTLKEFILKNPAITRQVRALHKLWYNVNFIMV